MLSVLVTVYSPEEHMSDTYRRYAAIKRSLMQHYPSLHGHRERHFNTLAAIICGLVGGRCAHLSSIADHAPATRADQESLIMRFRRWLAHQQHSYDTWFLPVAQALLLTLSHQPLLLAIDGSVVGRGCMALMVSVVWNGRALPVCWLVVKAKKGHLPQALHCALLRQLHAVVPADAEVIVLGDGEFDGTDLQAVMDGFGWSYVVRTAPHVCMSVAGYHTHIRVMEPLRGELLGVREAWLTRAQYGPVNVLGLWEAVYDAPLYLVTNMEDVDAAFAAYRNRAHIETFFSDQKSRGFEMQRSHLSEPARVSRLLMASCLAYLWVVYLGVCATSKEWQKRLHRQDRCDLSVFRLGLRLLARCLKDVLPIPDGLLIPRSMAQPPM
jgi:hypothetical protein